MPNSWISASLQSKETEASRQNRRAGAVIDPLADGEAVFAGMAGAAGKGFRDRR